MGLFVNSKKKVVKKAKFMGMRTAVDSEYHMLGRVDVNYTLYSFFVEYTDGTSGTEELTASRSKSEKERLQLLMKLANKTDEPPKAATPCDISNSDTMDELKKAKELFDSGVIPEDLYLSMREQLLNKLVPKQAPIANEQPHNMQNEQPHNIQNEQAHNIQIDRTNYQGNGESDTLLYIDGQKKSDINITSSAAISLPNGHHTISFRRAAVKSNNIDIDIVDGKVYHITFAPKLFSIETNVSVTKS